MRICVVSQEFPPGYVGGIGSQTDVKARALAGLGHEVEVLTAGPEKGPALRTRDEGALRVHEVRTPGGEFAVYRTETYWLGYSWAVLGAIRALSRERRFDVVDFPDYGAEGLAFALDRQDDDPTAVAVHLHGSLRMFAEQIGWPEPGESLHEVGTAMEELTIRRADRRLAASASIATFTTERLGIPGAEIDVVLGAVDTDAFRPGDRGPTPESVRLLFVGNVEANKGVWSVFEAFRRLAGDYPRLTLTIAGPWNPDIASEMRTIAGTEGLADRLELLGFVEHDQVAALYRSADLLAAPSQFEGGLGMVYLEAMACGLPVIATAAGGAAEAIVPGETGILLERGDAEETTAAVEALVAHPERGRQLGAAGRRRVQERFAPRPYAERVAAAYERAVEQRRSKVVRWE